MQKAIKGILPHGIYPRKATKSMSIFNEPQAQTACQQWRSIGLSGFIAIVLCGSLLSGCTTYLQGWKQQKASFAQIPEAFARPFKNELNPFSALPFTWDSDCDNWEARSFIDGFYGDINSYDP